MDVSDSHDEGIRWLSLAAESGQNHQAKQVCLTRAIRHLDNAIQLTKNTSRYAKALRNLGMAHWLLARVKSQSSAPSALLEAGEIYSFALRSYARFIAESVRPASHDHEYTECLEDALKLCELVPPKEAVQTIESYLGVIPDRHGSCRYTCLVKMSDVLEHHAQKSPIIGNWDETPTKSESGDLDTIYNKQDPHKCFEGITAAVPDERLSPAQTDRGEPSPIYETNPPVCSINDNKLNPMDTLSALRQHQHPKHIKYKLSDPEHLSSLAVLVELGKAKYYFGMPRIQAWIEQEEPGLHKQIMEAISRALGQYRRLTFAVACLDDIQHINKHSAYQLLCTLHSVYAILTPFNPGFSLPGELLKNLARVRYALGESARYMKADIMKIENADDDVYRIVQHMLGLIHQAKLDLEKVAEVEKMSTDSLGVLKHLREMWDGFHQILPENNTELGVLLATRDALNLATKADKDDFVLVLCKRLQYFETEPVVHRCITQLLTDNYGMPIQILSVLYQAYPPKEEWSLITKEDVLTTLPLRQIRRHLDTALMFYLEYTTVQPESRHVRQQVRNVLLQVREQLNRPNRQRHSSMAIK